MSEHFYDRALRLIGDAALIYFLWHMAGGALTMLDLVLALFASVLVMAIAGLLMGVCEGLYLGLRERLRNV